MRKQILGYRCRKCGYVNYPYRTRCRQCRHVEWDGVDIVFDAVPLETAGTLLTFTDAYALPADFEKVKLSLGIVELDGGQRVTGQLAIADPQPGMRVEMRVELVRTDGYEKRYGAVFYAGQAGAPAAATTP